MTAGTDAVLVAAAQAGEPGALAALLADHLPLVYGVVRQALPGDPDVDDVVQETMLRAIRKLAGLREPDRFRAWLIAIAYRQIQDRYRWHATLRARQRPLDADLRAPDFVEDTLLRLSRYELLRAGRLLSTEDRRIFELWLREQTGLLSRAELAQTLALSPAHTAVRIHRMRTQLDLARAVTRAWRRQPRCPGLDAAARDQPERGRLRTLARHLRKCPQCTDVGQGERISPSSAASRNPVIRAAIGTSV